jgi:membrane-associated protease RseP (regulator of RpoE activity)
MKIDFVKKVSVLVLLPVICACASVKPGAAKPSGQKIGDLGFVPDIVNNVVAVYSVLPNSPAEKAGLQAGDIILASNGAEIVKPVDFYNELYASPNKKLTLRIKRNNKELVVKAKADSYEIPPNAEDVFYVAKEIWKGNNFKVAIICDKAESFVHGPTQVAEKTQWERTMKSEQVNAYTAAFLKGFPNARNFSIVDRNNLDKVIKELKFQMTGAVDADTVKQMGKLLGITHILAIETNLYPKNSTACKLSVSRNLIEVETGRVVSSVNFWQDIPLAQ